jgi:hypothetical protein
MQIPNTIDINYHISVVICDISVIANQALQYRASIFFFPQFFMDMTLNTLQPKVRGARLGGLNRVRLPLRSRLSVPCSSIRACQLIKALRLKNRYLGILHQGKFLIIKARSKTSLKDS